MASSQLSQTPTSGKAIFRQSDFSGGLDTQLDATKTPDSSYPLLINGRTRRNVVSTTNRHVELTLPAGNKQGLYVIGDFLVVFVDGMAYYANISDSSITFLPVAGWSLFDPDKSRIYAELAPATSNLFNRTGQPDSMMRVFNNSLAIFTAALYCFDGVNPPQAILPTGVAVPLGSYATWTKDNPLYVPVGVLPALANNKLFLADPNRRTILSSVSGRCSDFVINIDNSGDKGGDVDTVSQAVSFNPITAIKPLSSGEILIGTIYGTFTLELDYTNTIFGEPFQKPKFLFPAGPLNEISIVDILSDTAMITQSGIHAFNAVAMAKRESNNFPLGAKIRGLLTNPTTEKAIIQEDTCAIIYDDYAFFAVNTIYGFGVVVYDTISQSFQSLDLSFGRVKQFANTRINGQERLFFITHDDKVLEAFADTKKNATRVLLGEWTPDQAPAQIVSHMVDMVFANVREPGQLKISVYGDHVLQESVVLEIAAGTKEVHLPISIPFVEDTQVVTTGFHFSHKARQWRMAAMIEWNFAGELTDFSVDGRIDTADNVTMEIPDKANTEHFAFTADSGYSDELNPGGVFGAGGFVNINVVQGRRYVYNANGNGGLVNGQDLITDGVFAAAGPTVAISGTGAMTFSLRTAENYLAVLEAITADKASAIIHGGDFAYNTGTELDVSMAKRPLRLPLFPVAGNHDVATNSGEYFFNGLGTPRYYTKDFEFISFFFFNANHSEPDGYDSLSLQAAAVKNWLSLSNKPYKILVCHQPPYTNDILHFPGDPALRYLIELPGLSTILAGHGHVMERFDIDGFPLFICGAGGSSLRSFVPGTTSAFRDNAHYGFISIQADALTCKLTFKDTNGNSLDTFSLYA